LLQEFIDAQCERIAKEYQMLNSTLPARLETVGIEYLFSDYVRKWTATSGVPLPLR
jgi:hypothetical protein